MCNPYLILTHTSEAFFILPSISIYTIHIQHIHAITTWICHHCLLTMGIITNVEYGIYKQYYSLYMENAITSHVECHLPHVYIHHQFESENCPGGKCHYPLYKGTYRYHYHKCAIDINALYLSVQIPSLSMPDMYLTFKTFLTIKMMLHRYSCIVAISVADAITIHIM